MRQAIITSSRRYKCKFTPALSCQTPAIKLRLVGRRRQRYSQDDVEVSQSSKREAEEQGILQILNLLGEENLGAVQPITISNGVSWSLQGLQFWELWVATHANFKPFLFAVWSLQYLLDTNLAEALTLAEMSTASPV